MESNILYKMTKIAIIILSVALVSLAKSQQVNDLIEYNVLGFTDDSYNQILLKYPYYKARIIFNPNPNYIYAEAIGFCIDVRVRAKGIKFWTKVDYGDELDIQDLGFKVANILVEHLSESKPLENLTKIGKENDVNILVQRIIKTY